MQSKIDSDDEIITNHFSEMLRSKDERVRAFYDAAVGLNACVRLFGPGEFPPHVVALVDDLRDLLRDDPVTTTDETITAYLALVDRIHGALSRFVHLCILSSTPPTIKRDDASTSSEEEEECITETA